MGRFKASEMDNYSTSSGVTKYFKLANDMDVARVRFLYNSLDDVEGYSVHTVKLPGEQYDKYVNCLRDYNDPIDACPFCKNRMPVVPKLFIPLYNETTGEVQVWERGKSFYATLSSTLSRIGNVSIVSQPFEIERHGKPRDTKTNYGIFAVGQPDDTRLEDFELPNVIGSKILDKTAEEMNEFLHTGDFGSSATIDTNQLPIRRRGERSSEPSEERQPAYTQRRVPTRREDVY